MAKKYTVREATRKRCKIEKLSDVDLGQYKQVSMELFHFFYEVDPLPFCLYFRADQEFIQFMKPEETSKELLDALQVAATKDFEVRVFPL